MPSVSAILYSLGLHANDRNLNVSFDTTDSDWNGLAPDYNDPDNDVWYFDGEASGAKITLSTAEQQRFSEIMAIYRSLIDESGATSPSSSLVVYKADLLGNTREPAISPKGEAWTYPEVVDGTTVTELETVFDTTTNFTSSLPQVETLTRSLAAIIPKSPMTATRM